MKGRGVASITEAMLVSIMMAVVVALSFTFFTNYYHAMSPKIKYNNIDVVLCGDVVTIKNIGEAPVKIEGFWGVYYQLQQTSIIVKTEWVRLNYVLQPGEIRNVVVSKPYSYIVVKTEDVRLDPVKNSCIQSIENGGVGGIR